MSPDQLYALMDAVTGVDSFLRFTEELANERRAVEDLPTTRDGFRGEWANQSIADFLEQATSWAQDVEFGTSADLKPKNPWKLFAMFLWAGRGYE